MVLDNNFRNLRTDLVIEAHSMVTAGVPEGFPGVNMEQEHLSSGKVSRVHVFNQSGAQRLGKPQGHYITFEVPQFDLHDPDQKDELIAGVSSELAALTQDHLTAEGSVLVVGLGNAKVTPDALGSLVVDQLLITRHFVRLMPEQLKAPVRAVGAIKPGVLGDTGIETFDIVKGVVSRVKPDLLIIIDALAARAAERLNRTIQICDSGIQPGGGVGNHRRALDQKGLGIPVIACGIPTVVDATTIVSDTLDQLLAEIVAEGGVEGRVETWYEQADQLHLRLKPLTGRMMVTANDIDLQIETMAEILATAIDRALNPHV